jgi:putative endonuclease
MPVYTFTSMALNHETGRAGEEYAVEYLVGKGFRILERNWHYRHLEVDIIAEKNKMLHIVEVKTRSSADFEIPRDSINMKKQKFLFIAAEAFAESRKLEMEIVFDIVEVFVMKEKPTVNFIPDAFRPGW